MDDPTALPSFPPPAGEHPLRGRVLDALLDDGLQPMLDDDGDVMITVDEQRLFVRCGEGELPVMRTFGQWRLGDEVPNDPLRQHMAAGDASMRLNLVKLAVHENVLFVALDIVVTPEMPLAPVLRSTIHAVLNGVRVWNETVMGVQDGAEGENLG